MLPTSPPPISSPSPLPSPSAPLFIPLSCEGQGVYFAPGRVGIYFVCKSKDGRTFTGQVPLGEVRR
jgi:hypothetical protein